MLIGGVMRLYSYKALQVSSTGKAEEAGTREEGRVGFEASRRMAIYHFKLSMVPREYFELRGLPTPSVLSEEEQDRGETEGVGWWARRQPSPNVLAQLRSLCPYDQSWAESEKYATSHHSDIQIWKGEGRVWAVAFRFSLNIGEYPLLDKFVTIAHDENCLLLEGVTRALFEPDGAIVAEHLNNSRAMHFARDPKSALIEAAKNTPQ
ncbi:hypothetical protein BH09VER1_BH09VER1_44280 [soil metagenome]